MTDDKEERIEEIVETMQEAIDVGDHMAAIEMNAQIDEIKAEED